MLPTQDPTTPARRVQCGIYKITCVPTGKFYIGSTGNIRKRWREHRRELDEKKHHSRHLQRAWDKYGHDQFSFEIIEIVEDKTDLVRIEQSYLDNLRPWSADVGYNVSPSADGTRGTKRTVEQRAAISERLRGKTQSPETRAKRSESMKGLKRAPEGVARTRQFHLGRKRTSEQRAKMSAAHKGKKFSGEGLANKRVEYQRRVGDPEFAAKVSAGVQKWWDERRAAKQAAQESVQLDLPFGD